MGAVCLACGRENRAEARFCDGCGAATNASAPEEEGERRQITILFCDLVESVSLSTRLDPEDFGRLMQQYEAAGEQAMEQFGGHVAQYLGDGLVVYFGYPQAHERAAERAVRAGLAVLENVEELDRRVAESLAVRVGIHTGEVVVQPMGRGDRRDPLALGDVVNIAARAQSLAEPGSLTITGATLRIVEGMFAVESLGFPTMKGVGAPLEVLRVIGPESDRLLSSIRNRSPFVGRREELARLAAHWAHAREGRGQVVQISGEPGIGKSRIVDELRRGLAGEDHLWLVCGGAPHRQHTPFATVGEMAAQAFGWKPDHPAASRLDDLDAGLAAAGLDPTEVSPLVAPVLGIVPEPGRYPGELRSAEQQREDLLAAMTHWLLAVARNRPLVVFTEDLHWLDPSSIELLDRMARAIVAAPVLMLQTARPDFVSPWPSSNHHARITIDPLDNDEVAELVAQLAPEGLEPAAMARVVARTDGVPLFVEEVLRTAAEYGDDRVDTVPPTLRDSLAARLDRVGSAKTVAQIASVLGIEFSFESLSDITDLDTDSLATGLDRLVADDIATVVGVRRNASYRFTHALLQETAYASLLRARRQELHGRVAEALTERSPALVALRPELLAHHLAGAGRTPEAVDAWERAATQAYSASAMAEAESHVARAIALLEELPEGDDRAATEMRLQILFGRVSSATHGMASPEMRKSYARALELGASLGDSSRLIGVLFGAWGSAFSRGDIAESELHLSELMRAFDAAPEPSMSGWVYYAQAATVFAHGDLRRADQLLDRIFGASHEHADRDFALGLAIVAVTHRLTVAWHLGRIDDAVASIEEYLRQADAMSAWELGMTLMSSCCLGIALRDPARVGSDAERLGSIAQEAALPTLVAWADMYRGWTLVEEGAIEAGIASIRKGLAAYLATEQRTGHPGYLSWIADAQLRGGDPVAALDTIRQAGEALPEEVIYVPTILSIRGAILEADPTLAAPSESATSCYRDAIAAAQKLGSVMFELQAATRLARLLGRDGDTAGAKKLLEPLLAHVIGGDNLPDVQEARAVFKEQ